MKLKGAYVSTKYFLRKQNIILCSNRSRDGTSTGVGWNPLNDPVLEGENEDVGEVGVSTTMGPMAGYWPGA